MVDFKVFATHLTNTGLMNKCFFDMTKEEINALATAAVLSSPKRCIYCGNWEENKTDWTKGKCKITGNTINNNSMCDIYAWEPDEVPF